MEGKFELQFEDNEYYLVDGNTNDTVATTDKVLLKEYDGYMKKLSLKNCEAIANGYDLDELAEKRFGKSLHHASNRHSFREGFQKALEILGDKKFSLEDMKKVYLNSSKYEWFGDCIKSLQQTEWDVEIVTKPFVSVGLIIADFSGDTPVDILNVKKEVVEEGYALDADGCLILTKKKS